MQKDQKMQKLVLSNSLEYWVTELHKIKLNLE